MGGVGRVGGVGGVGRVGGVGEGGGVGEERLAWCYFSGRVRMTDCELLRIDME